MSDYRRIRIPGGCYFFTLVTYRRKPLFSNYHAVDMLRNAMRTERKRRLFDVDAMVVLPDHMHCIWQLPDGDADYSSRWREIKKGVTRSLAYSLPPIWQPRFWEHRIRNIDDWKNHMDYIHYNPVKHGLVSSPKDWPYSSFASAVSKGWYEPEWGASEPPANIHSLNCE